MRDVSNQTGSLRQNRDSQGSRWAQARPSAHGPSRRAALVGLVLIAGLVGLALWWLLAPPPTLDKLHLGGARGPAPLNIMVLLDDSGSFDEYTAMRHTALDEVLRWSAENLRDDDTITVVTFSSNAILTLPETPIATLRDGATLNTSRSAGLSTEIQPALQLAAESVDTSHQGTLIIVTDTEVSDAHQQQTDVLARNANAATMSVILPHGMTITDEWSTAFAWEQELTADPDAPDEIALAIAEAIAHATGQTLERR